MQGLTRVKGKDRGRSHKRKKYLCGINPEAVVTTTSSSDVSALSNYQVTLFLWQGGHTSYSSDSRPRQCSRMLVSCNDKLQRRSTASSKVYSVRDSARVKVRETLGLAKLKRGKAVRSVWWRCGEVWLGVCPAFFGERLHGLYPFVELVAFLLFVVFKGKIWTTKWSSSLL